MVEAVIELVEMADSMPLNIKVSCANTIEQSE